MAKRTEKVRAKVKPPELVRISVQAELEKRFPKSGFKVTWRNGGYDISCSMSAKITDSDRLNIFGIVEKTLRANRFIDGNG